MPDNELTGTGKAVATRKVTYSGDIDQNLQAVQLAVSTGADDAKTAIDLPGDAANGLDVDVTRLPALVAGASAVGRLTGTASTANSSTAALGISGIFTGTFEEVKDYAAISIIVFANVASAIDGLEFQWSSDGVNADVVTGSTVNASAGRAFNTTPRARYFRVRYTNGGTAQTTFRLGVTYHPSGSGLISRPLDQTLDPENYGQTVRAACDGFDGTNFVHIAARTGAPGAADAGLVVREAPAIPIFMGRAATFRTPGRAGTAGQKILSLHNATGSPVIVTVKRVVVDLMQTAVKAITVAPPVIRLWKVTVLPTNGTALTKNKVGGSGSSNAAVTVLGDASADGTGSATTLTATLPAGTIVTQEFAPRFITAAGYEMADRIEFLSGDDDIELGALEGVVLFLDYTAAGQNPTTDMWLAGIMWEEK